MSIIRITKKFRAILSRHQKLRVIELAIIMVFGGLLEMLSVSLIIPFMNMVIDPSEIMGKWYVQAICEAFHLQSERSFLIFAAIVLACVYILKNVYLILQYSIQYRFVYGNMFEMQRRLLDSYIHRPYEFFLKINSGEVMRIVSSDTSNTFALLSTLLILFSELIVSVMLIGTVFVIAPFATLFIAAVMLFLLIVINLVLKPILRNCGKETQAAVTGMNKWLLQSIQGIKELKVMEKEGFFQKNYDRFGYRYVNATRRSSILGMIPRFFIEAFSMGTMFILVAIMIFLGSDMETIVPILTAVAMAAMRLLPSVNRISNGLADIAFREPMLDKLIENLNVMTGENSVTFGSRRPLQSERESAEESQITPLKEAIHFQDISFHYPEAEKNVLSGASMVIREGESIGVVGSSGAGKTTAIDIILGLLHPQQGHILIDQTDISTDMHGWHQQIGYIPQMIFMLDDTIRHNVCFGIEEEDISEEALWRALRDASLEDFVRSLPDGVNTEIGERGVRLSGGQRQRIGIARALYQDPSILIFDEATSALDSQTESEIMESIHHLHGQKTMIIIAHRLTTIEACDHIYRVENGKIEKER